ncbi:MAG TPA: STAS domain-containing protein [Pyrinomonadaceae bacterium]|jgi:anti-anti-sigma regulatory factor|nr:STAS domain-containing protein [Pyrinomonadaceae bacterium]
MDELLDTAPCGFIAFGNDGHILAANATLLGWLGLGAGGLAGRHVESILPPGGRIFYQTYFFPLLVLHGRAEEIYLSLRGAGGEEVPVLANAARRERGGSPVNDCVFVPMRQRRRFEDELLSAKKEAEEANRTKDALIEELSTPVITVWDGVLLGPVIGSLSRERADLMTAALLRAVVERRARVVILDITGVRTMDADVVRRLTNVAAAVRLMGAECVLTGVGAGVARTLVRAGIELGGLEVRRTLADGLTHALRAARAPSLHND